MSSFPGWQERCRFITREGNFDFYHYDPYSQALSKIERGHDKDLKDVEAMVEYGLIDREKLLGFYTAIEPQLYRYPAIDPASFLDSIRRTVSIKH